MNRYRTTLRPAGFGGLPSRVAYTYIEAPTHSYYPGLAHLPRSQYRYGVIETDRPLTREEMDHFDIVEVS